MPPIMMSAMMTGESAAAAVAVLDVGPDVGGHTGSGVGAELGSAVGVPVGSGAGTKLGRAVGARVGEGDGGFDGSGDGAGVGENVATSTESAVALAIDSRRAPRSSGSASRRRAAAVWIAVVKLPSLTAAPSTAITCEWTECSPPTLP